MLYRNQNDETLVMLTLAGEQDAYEVLVTKYQNAVIAAAASVTRNHFMAEDAAQDAFVTAWMKLDTLKEPKKFASWVCRIAKNCALNMLPRYRSFLPLDDAIGFVADSESLDPENELVRSEEKRRDAEDLRKSVEGLPEKVGEIIRLHYFEGLSIAEIADRMRISEGTVKSQLHDGRKRIRKELCAMDEKWNDTLVRKVMKKVEELKLWQTKNDKSGFEKVYRSVLSEVEDLPESKDKNHALADVLMRGWWWIPGETSDAMFSRIRQAAEDGKNEEVMEFICTREDGMVYGGARIDFIRDKQIPRLEEKGFIKAQAREWFWLAREYYKTKQREKGREAYMKARSLLSPEDKLYWLTPAALELYETKKEQYKDKNDNSYRLTLRTDELRTIDGRLNYWGVNRLEIGNMYSGDESVDEIIRYCSCCDGIFFPEISLGESLEGSDGTTITYISNRETVSTPAGSFEGCSLYEIKYYHRDQGFSTFRTYYKDGVGIVRFEHILDGIKDVRILSSYKIVGGKGLLPLYAGNRWEYANEYDESVMISSLSIEVSYADFAKAILISKCDTERLRYDESSWLDMIEKIRNEYCTNGDHQKICDVYDAIERAELLAKTPLEKAHAKVACSVARRILETDPEFNKECTATGHWNFFNKKFTRIQNGTVTMGSNFRWSFEWKNADLGHAGDPILYNGLIGILQDATNCIWSDEWVVGAEPSVEYFLWGSRKIKTDIVCEASEPITTKAGTFIDCIKLTLDIGGLTDGFRYRGGKKEYYFARGIGIVKTVNHTFGGACKAIYELTKYEGEGEGYMPIVGGLFRRYDAIGLTDGYEGAVEYTYVEEDGQVFIFSDQIGIKHKQAPVSSYSTIEHEVVEDRLWEEGKREESRLRHDANNIHLMLHFLCRPSRYWAAPHKAIAWNMYRMKIIEGFGENGEIPTAWLGLYAATCFRTACALFGHGRREEGYEYLEKSFAPFEEWDKIPDGAETDTGDTMLFGGVKMLKNKGALVFPDGTKEPIDDGYVLRESKDLLYRGMTAKQGWEWFNPVRDEERFKEYIERARKLIE